MRKIAQIIVLVFIFTIPWENAFVVSTLGSLTRVIGLVAAGSWIVSAILRNRIRRLQFYHFVVFAFVIYNMLSLLWTADYDYTMAHLKTYLQLGILAWMLWDLFTTPEMLRNGMQAFIFGSYIVIASSFYNFISGQTISQYEYGRFSGAGQNAVELALILSMSLPVAWHLVTTSKPGRGTTILKVINFVYVPAALSAAVLTGSRTSLLTLIPALLYIAIAIHRFRPIYRLAIFIVFILVVFIGQSFIPQATLARLGTIGESIAAGDIGGRVSLWGSSISIFLDHTLLGLGSGALVAPGQLGGAAHNTFLSVLAELGLIGFTLFIIVLASVLIHAINQPRMYSFLWLTVLSIWLIGVQSLTYEYTKPTWFFLNIIVISSATYKRFARVTTDSHNHKKAYGRLDTIKGMPAG